MGKKLNYLITSVLIGGIFVLSPSNSRIETKTLENGKEIQVEKCSIFLDNGEVWKKYAPKSVEEIDSLFKDGKGKFYACNKNDYCRKAF